MDNKYEGGVDAKTVILNAAKRNFDGKLDFYDENFRLLRTADAPKD